MDNLQWFKFSPADWMMGRIQRQPPQVQVDFLRLCCKYWQKDGLMSVEDAEIEAMDSYDTLVKYKVVKVEDESIVIDFLDEQLLSLEGKRKQASEAGKRSAEVRRRKKESNDRSTTVDKQFNENEQSREEKRREEKIIKHKLIIWLEENAPRVQKMSNPITNAEAERLKKDFSNDVIIEIFTNMHNYKPLTKTVSANLTFRRWAKNRTTETKEKFIPQPPKI